MSVDQNDGRFLPGRIAATLDELPIKLLEIEKEIVGVNRQVKELEESVKMAETNASLNVMLDEDDKAETRKLKTNRAIATDSEVKRTRQELWDAQAKQQMLDAQGKQISRRFAALCHVAEMEAAQMILQAKGVTK